MYRMDYYSSNDKASLKCDHRTFNYTCYFNTCVYRVMFVQFFLFKSRRLNIQVYRTEYKYSSIEVFYSKHEVYF